MLKVQTGTKQLWLHSSWAHNTKGKICSQRVSHIIHESKFPSETDMVSSLFHFHLQDIKEQNEGCFNEWVDCYHLKCRLLSWDRRICHAFCMLNLSCWRTGSLLSHCSYYLHRLYATYTDLGRVSRKKKHIGSCNGKWYV